MNGDHRIHGKRDLKIHYPLHPNLPEGTMKGPTLCKSTAPVSAVESKVTCKNCLKALAARGSPKDPT